MADGAGIQSISVTGLQGHFDYKISFKRENANVIVIAPNGFGKTAFLSLINHCLQFNLAKAARQKFQRLEVLFFDKKRWVFEKVTELQPRRPSRELKASRTLTYVKATIIDAKGNEQPADTFPEMGDENFEAIARAMERSLRNLGRISLTHFRDIYTGEEVAIPDAVEKYRGILANDPEFLQYVKRYAPNALTPNDKKINCVFIETQRLLLAKSLEKQIDGPTAREPEEEIVRQVQSLAAMLAKTQSNYASISQDLDRSFPSRLINRATVPKRPIDLKKLRSELAEIEEKRKALTEAGLLVDTTDQVVAPEDQLLPTIADTLQIYAEDSKKKLSTFDDAYRRVSVFKTLLNKKLWRKEVHISREIGVDIRSGKDRLDITQLSSGEKHEFVMLFRLIFETPDHSVVLIDEPEISLHVLWQLEFMSDLQQVQSVTPFQAIIATHSPQITQGWAEITHDLDEQVA